MTEPELRWKRVALIASAAIMVLVLLVIVRRPFGQTALVKAYFANAAGIRSGAAVRLAGVDIGTVKDVRVRPEVKEAPVEVIMALNRTPALHIPADSTGAQRSSTTLRCKRSPARSQT